MSSAPRSASSRMFDGLTSRCTRPAACSASSAEAISATIRVDVLERQRPVLADAVVERLARHVVHGQEAGAVDVAGLDHVDQLRVVDLGGGARLAGEAAGRLVVAHEARLEHLQRHDRPVLVDRAEDDPHPALAELLVDDVRAEGVARLQRPRVGLAPERHGASIGVGWKKKPNWVQVARLGSHRRMAGRRLTAYYVVLVIAVAAVATLVLSAGAKEEPEPAIAGGYDVTQGQACLGEQIDLRQSGQFVGLRRADGSGAGKLRFKAPRLTGEASCLAGGTRPLRAPSAPAPSPAPSAASR